ncbi:MULTISPECIES: hypothetical protein [unclassified Streptomyces]|uniref:hypothetical protein n=1 Tax=unclassified Streptomyces TaxID=2593676 RepID=UPI0022538275|nr:MULTISPECIES: hypothetical protein [unclassified Streptomyces]MCX4406779.1 hypothetical protein [Streptomyces sp. NBC_01764]MCX5188534.1 hypothetical protein [Streptomyces sp. NBC_00268]
MTYKEPDCDADRIPPNVIDHFYRSFLAFPGQAIVVENAPPPPDVLEHARIITFSGSGDRPGFFPHAPAPPAGPEPRTELAGGRRLRLRQPRFPFGQGNHRDRHGSRVTVASESASGVPPQARGAHRRAPVATPAPFTTLTFGGPRIKTVKRQM